MLQLPQTMRLLGQNGRMRGLSYNRLFAWKQTYRVIPSGCVHIVNERAIHAAKHLATSQHRNRGQVVRALFEGNF